MMADIEQMKAELEANGYYNFPDLSETQWTLPSCYDDAIINIDCVSCEDPDIAILEAYVHLQQQRKLNALEAFVLARRTSDPIADDIVNEYNITADDESEDDE